MIHKIVRHLIFWSCTVTLFISGCASTPDYSNDQVRFKAGKDAFLAHKYVQAAQLFEPLAIKGHSQAQYTLGYLYYYGLGISQNSEIGKRWIASAAKKGNQRAVKALELISKEKAATKEQTEEEIEKTVPDTTEADQVPIPAAEPAIEVVTPPTTTDTPAELPTQSNIEAVTQAQSWISLQPPSNYTIQLTSLKSEAAAKNFLSNNPLNQTTELFPYRLQGEMRYGIIYGSFSTYTQAKEALNNLPDLLAKSSPWIRNFKHIHEVLLQP